ncbi:cellulose synthase-like protein E1 isoform X1 [Cannabis sativa]|uniref:cellulose synthase-like protein E1 isoform X1 n=1 Tax=Cannabis sativa TaxID=3483 RepID=UPI0029CA491F|nr:cellulose synthase-like protein E1 isoform X1 [Cannabis sativa]
MDKNHDDDDGYLPLFETKSAKSRTQFRLFVVSMLVGICSIFVYRLRYIPFPTKEEEGAVVILLVWIGLFVSEFWFTLYWFVTLVVRWNPVYRHTFKDRLILNRYGEKDLPGVDIFVCTADPKAEPPLMVVNTVLSVMAYDYPPHKLSVYLSDDGASELTFYALLEASEFSKEWLPFCNKFKVEPRSPEAYFTEIKVSQPLDDDDDDHNPNHSQWASIKRLYVDMKTRIESATKVGQISEIMRREHKGFCEWDSILSKRDHQTIIQILIDGRDPKAVDIDQHPLPTLVYLAREKRPQYHHNFKAGAMNSLIRVSGQISNAPIILNVDCDMYSNNSESVRDAMCFFLDEKKGQEIAYIQFPQAFENITENDIYNNSLRDLMEVDLRGFDSNGGPCYIGTGCFHRRESLSGKKYNEADKILLDCKRKSEDEGISAEALEETSKVLANCSYEENTLWGKEMGLMYGCLVEDMLTGLVIQCRGWRSVYYSPERKAFLGAAPTTLLQVLVQQKRWAEGDLQILLSRYCPLTYGYGKIPLGLRLSYLVYFLWSLNCFASLYYVIVPSLCLLKGISLFPQMSNIWFVPFVYVFFGNRVYSLGEHLMCGGSYREWFNCQRMWLFKRTTSFFFGFLDNMIRLLGYSGATFIITAKVVDDDVSERYKKELIEFGTTSPMFTILTTLALLNALGLIWGLKRLLFTEQGLVLNPFLLQVALCCLLVFINLPIYQAIFTRKDKGRLPNSVIYQSIMLNLVVCSIVLY